MINNKRKGLINMFETFLNDYMKECECDEMEMEVLNSLSEEEIKCIYDYGICSAAPALFTYYYQTNNFFDRNSDKCLEILQQAINDCYINPNNFEFTRNNITWLCVELIISDFMCYYEENKYRYEEELEEEEDEEEE